MGVWVCSRCDEICPRFQNTLVGNLCQQCFDMAVGLGIENIDDMEKFVDKSITHIPTTEEKLKSLIGGVDHENQ